MNIVIDVTLVLVAVITVVLYTKIGFIRSVFGAGKFLVSLILSYLLTPYLGTYIAGTPLYSSIERAVHANIFSSSETVGTEALTSISVFICNLIAFVMILFVSYILLTLMGFLLNKLFHLPVLRHFNNAAGFCLGVVCAVINVLILTVVVTLVTEMGVITSPRPLKETTIIYKFICQTNVATEFVRLFYGA